RVVGGDQPAQAVAVDEHRHAGVELARLLHREVGVRHQLRQRVEPLLVAAGVAVAAHVLGVDRQPLGGERVRQRRVARGVVSDAVDDHHRAHHVAGRRLPLVRLQAGAVRGGRLVRADGGGASGGRRVRGRRAGARRGATSGDERQRGAEDDGDSGEQRVGFHGAREYRLGWAGRIRQMAYACWPMNLRLLWVIGLFVPAAAALAGDDGSLEPAADPPQGWFARVREKAQVVDAAVDAVETSLGAGGAQAPPVEKANQLVAAWNELMDTTEEAIRHFENGPLLRDVLMKWSIDFREGPDQPLFRLPTSGPLVVESARILAVNTVRQRQLAREAEGWRGLRQIEAAGFTLSTPFVRGYAPPPCANGSRPPTPDDSWTAGCEFVFRIGPMQEGKPPVAVARGVAGPVTGVELRLTIDQDVERVAGPPVDRLPFPTQKLKKGIGRPPALVNPALRPILPFG